MILELWEGRREILPYEHQFYSTIMKGIFSLISTMSGLFLQLIERIQEPSDIPKEYNAIAMLTGGWIVLKRT